MGRRTFDFVDGPNGWEDDLGFGGERGEWSPPPNFVLTHAVPEKVRLGSAFTFVTDGIQSAFEQAKAAAGDKHVCVMGGAHIAQQCIEAGLLDEIRIHLAPILLGEGTRLFEHIGTEQIKLERTGVIESPFATHLSFRVVKEN
jgi:dihydrofolate reductase